MARLKADVCMICNPDPCECFAPKAAPRPKKRPVVEGSLPEQEAPEASGGVSGPPRQDLRAKMKAAAAQAGSFVPERIERKQTRHTETEMTKAAPAARPIASDETLLEHAALRALGDILCTEDRERFRMIISSTPTPVERKAEWRARRAWQLQQ